MPVLLLSCIFSHAISASVKSANWYTERLLLKFESNFLLKVQNISKQYNRVEYEKVHHLLANNRDILKAKIVTKNQALLKLVFCAITTWS